MSNRRSAGVRRALLAVLLAVVALSGAQAAASSADLLSDRWSGGLIANHAFAPGRDAQPAHKPFSGTLAIAETAMWTDPAAFKSATVLGKDPRLFPSVALAFFTDSGDLVPVSQDVIRAGSLGGTRSYWDIIVQPGRIWSEQRDNGWSRAAFPFALMNSIEGETHNGLATFLYKGGQVSNLRFQIVQQTAQFYVTDHFSAAGLAHMSFAAGGIAAVDALKDRYRAALHDAVPVADWRVLTDLVGEDRLKAFDGALDPAAIVLSGLDYQGTFYLKQCNSAAGPLPWCDRTRFGVWSVTKALVASTALLRLAQKYGPGVFDLKIADYIPQAAAAPAWHNVRFGDAINMATGVGSSGIGRQQANFIDPTDAHYAAWYEARSADEKVAAAIATSEAYPWGPNAVARYRDQDMFLLGVAMDALLKSKEGPAADLWTMLEDEVYRPVGIHYAPINRTIEPDGRRGVPLTAFGFYATLSDLVKIARLYHAHGIANGVQLLYRPRIDQLLYGSTPRGFPTGFGETTYFTGFWETPYLSPEGCRTILPRMQGFGGNLVALMPNGMTAIRLGSSADESNPAVDDVSGMATVADRLARFCD